MESKADKEEYLNVDDFRSSKLKRIRGWKLLMWGIMVETAVAGVFAARDGWEIRQTNAKIRLETEGIQLSAKQKADFKSALSVLRGKFVVWYTLEDKPTVSFAQQINDLLETNGFNSVQPPSYRMVGVQTKGIILEAASPTNPPFAANLKFAFMRMGFNVVGSIRAIDPHDPNVLSILIGIQGIENSN